MAKDDKSNSFGDLTKNAARKATPASREQLHERYRRKRLEEKGLTGPFLSDAVGDLPEDYEDLTEEQKARLEEVAPATVSAFPMRTAESPRAARGGAGQTVAEMQQRHQELYDQGFEGQTTLGRGAENVLSEGFPLDQGEYDSRTGFTQQLKREIERLVAGTPHAPINPFDPEGIGHTGDFRDERADESSQARKAISVLKYLQSIGKKVDPKLLAEAERRAALEQEGKDYQYGVGSTRFPPDQGEYDPTYRGVYEATQHVESLTPEELAALGQNRRGIDNPYGKK